MQSAVNKGRQETVLRQISCNLPRGQGGGGGVCGRKLLPHFLFFLFFFRKLLQDLLLPFIGSVGFV